ncbi:MAG: hypothetical protein AMXMBFR4_13270 [Candidatus Hydrogenedentota bacterium]
MIFSTYSPAVTDTIGVDPCEYPVESTGSIRYSPEAKPDIRNSPFKAEGGLFFGSNPSVIGVARIITSVTGFALSEVWT